MQGNETQSSFSDNSSEEAIRRINPLISKEEGYTRMKKHSELAESEDIIDKFDGINKVYDDLGKWALTTEVDSKMNTFKQALASDTSPDKDTLWELIKADLIISYQQTKMNEFLLKNNADLKCQVAMAKDIFTRTQTEAIDTLKGVVKDSLDLVKSREEEAAHWNKTYHEANSQSEKLRKELRILQKKLDDSDQKLLIVNNESRTLAEKLERFERANKEKETIVNRQTQELQESKKKITLLQTEIDQKTDEVAALDNDVRKAAVTYNQLKEKQKREMDQCAINFETKLNEQLDKQESHLNENHKKQIDQLLTQIKKLENERQIILGKLENYKSHVDDFRRENDYLKRNAKQIKQDLLAQCQRRVFSVLNYDSQSDSPPTAHSTYSTGARVRSRSVTFPNEPVESSVENRNVPTPEADRGPSVPPISRPVLPPATSIRRRPASHLRDT